MRIFRPDHRLVSAFVGCASANLPPIKLACTRTPDAEWYKNHRSYVLQELLPTIRPPDDVWRVCAEAYLTDVEFDSEHENYDRFLPGASVVPGRKYAYEQVLSDGSSLVPDLAYDHGKIKDPWAVAHDLLYMLHDYRLPDAYGRRWGFWASNNLYRRGWIAQEHHVIANVWWFGLAVGGWVPWLLPKNDVPEPREFVDNCLPLCPLCKTMFVTGGYNPS